MLNQSFPVGAGGKRNCSELQNEALGAGCRHELSLALTCDLSSGSVRGLPFPFILGNILMFAAILLGNTIYPAIWSISYDVFLPTALSIYTWIILA